MRQVPLAAAARAGMASPAGGAQGPTQPACRTRSLGISAAAGQVIEVAIDGVFVGGWIVEISIVHHHLRLDERRLAHCNTGNW
jgi:hypothetical protein